MVETVYLGLIGCGTVGGGVYEILKKQQDQFLQRYGKEYIVKTICVKHVDKKRDVEIDPTTKIVDDYMIILDDPDISIVIELIGGTTDAWTIMQECFKRGKHIITYPETELIEGSFIELETKPCYRIG
ncbi:homoserine dehydrogenase [Blastocystis sp. subtype 4]|uniref:homoserine dehydrogenase n=1 Tax=Blastocystis sp. subtype 4 TaxID=944170 RepID=UPI00071188AF|nr:homoserine dehydrogenase [Blastocystis sp. subtype 4]KNB43888.1 homoserine dehydrogenase [Blastocystis sp. subtype 4]|eukprot:XP_014527339.1 homoserine dehydrogenase [Blastocystis sp. subtype 4]